MTEDWLISITVKRAAAHLMGGCHYFQCYDQFVLGRFDGENYNIGLFDICSPALSGDDGGKACGADLYEVAAGKNASRRKKAERTAMIAFGERQCPLKRTKGLMT